MAYIFWFVVIYFTVSKIMKFLEGEANVVYYKSYERKKSDLNKRYNPNQSRTVYCHPPNPNNPYYQEYLAELKKLDEAYGFSENK